MGNEVSKSASTSTSDLSHSGSTVRAMDHTFQDLFRKGIAYNIRIVIRGDSQSGKTSLFRKLQNKKLKPYKKTPQIQADTINWKYKDNNDVVKMEIWDVVDKGSLGKKSLSGSFRQSFDSKRSSLANGIADASTVNVYNNANGTIILFNPHEENAMFYVLGEILKVPEHIPVLVIANFCDQPDEMYNLDVLKEELAKAETQRGQLTKLVMGSVTSNIGYEHVEMFLDYVYLNVKVAHAEQTLACNKEAREKCKGLLEGCKIYDSKMSKSVSLTKRPHTSSEEASESGILNATSSSVTSSAMNEDKETLTVLDLEKSRQDSAKEFSPDEIPEAEPGSMPRLSEINTTPKDATESMIAVKSASIASPTENSIPEILEEAMLTETIPVITVETVDEEPVAEEPVAEEVVEETEVVPEEVAAVEASTAEEATVEEAKVEEEAVQEEAKSEETVVEEVKSEEPVVETKVEEDPQPEEEEEEEEEKEEKKESPEAAPETTVTEENPIPENNQPEVQPTGQPKKKKSHKKAGKKKKNNRR